jgi:hypothetical protein
MAASITERLCRMKSTLPRERQRDGKEDDAMAHSKVSGVMFAMDFHPRGGGRFHLTGANCRTGSPVTSRGSNRGVDVGDGGGE